MGGHKTEKKIRKTLIQLQDEFGVSDPSAHAKRQVGELDKTAQRSLAKRKATDDQLAADTKELKHLNAQIAELNKSYIPLCKGLEDKLERRIQFLKQLDLCLKNQKDIFNNIKGTVNRRKLDDSKLSRKMATMELTVQRGYSLGLDSTFRQSNKLSNTKGSGSLMLTKKMKGASSTPNLPGINDGGMKTAASTSNL